MSQMRRVVIPYESIDPLTIGAAENDELVYRDTLELDIPEANLLAEIRPDEPEALPNATDAAAHALEHPHSGPRFSELLAAAATAAVAMDKQFRPTPPAR